VFDLRKILKIKKKTILLNIGIDYFSLPIKKINYKEWQMLTLENVITTIIALLFYV